ncbi:hypothetical protein ACFJYS_04165 [Enterococcus faecalis]|nr:MAG TPA: hypothetical protein [Caudoviricetes sp.]
MEGLCQIWAKAITQKTKKLTDCPKVLVKRVKEILKEQEAAE